MEKVPSSALDAFVELLNRRFSAGVRTTEDSVRYMFYNALFGQAFGPEAVILEDLHAEIKGARVDTLILDLGLVDRTGLQARRGSGHRRRCVKP